MAEEINLGHDTIIVGDREFATSDLSARAKSQWDNLHFVNEQIAQKSNEIQIADTARLMYYSVLRSNLANGK